jgi:hypothetical protein
LDERNTVEKYIFDSVTFEPDSDVVAKRMRVGHDTPHHEELLQFIHRAQAVARPKAMYKVGYIDAKGDDWVVIDGIRFTSRVLRVNLDQAHRVFAYLATCGVELQDWARSLDDPLEQYWGNTIQEMALRAASQAMSAHIVQHYQPGRTAAMAPGSLGEWPIPEQRPLFALLGSDTEVVGVQLLDSLLMTPTKSISGIRFPTEERFESCQLCPRPDCPGRRAPYDETLYERKYQYSDATPPQEEK